MTTSLLASSVLVLAGMLAAGAAGMLTSSIMSHGKRREDLYDRLYSLRWGDPAQGALFPGLGSGLFGR